MHRFFIFENYNFQENFSFVPSKELFHQLKHVLRITINEKIIIVNQKAEYYANFDGEKIIILEKITPKKISSNMNLTLIQGTPKNIKQKWIIQKATELGIDKIIFWDSKRTVAKLNNLKNKKEKFEKIIIEACEQSGRVELPQLDFIYELDQFNFFNEDDLIIVAYENANYNLNNSLEHIKRYKNIYLVIGPEGGLEEREVTFFEKHNAKIVSLGPTILRTETAAIALVAIVKNILNEI